MLSKALSDRIIGIWVSVLSSRVDVNKNESSNSQERVIVIRGQQENCSQACREVLRIMYEDAQNKNKAK